MSWTFEREARWMLWLALVPAMIVAGTLLWRRLMEALGL